MQNIYLFYQSNLKMLLHKMDFLEYYAHDAAGVPEHADIPDGVHPLVAKIERTPVLV